MWYVNREANQEIRKSYLPWDTLNCSLRNQESQREGGPPVLINEELDIILIRSRGDETTHPTATAIEGLELMYDLARGAIRRDNKSLNQAIHRIALSVNIARIIEAPINSFTAASRAWITDLFNGFPNLREVLILPDKPDEEAHMCDYLVQEVDSAINVVGDRLKHCRNIALQLTSVIERSGSYTKDNLPVVRIAKLFMEGGLEAFRLKLKADMRKLLVE